jgi:hypothetical protein
MHDLLCSFMINQATPHFGALSSLINNKNSNHHWQPRMGIALTTEWEANTQMSRQIRRTEKALECKQRHPMMMEHQRGGTYISNQVRMHACHPTSNHCIYFWIVTGKILKERIIELMKAKKSLFWPWNGNKMRQILPLGKSQRNEKINPIIKRSLRSIQQSGSTKFSSLILSSLQDFSSQVILPGKSHFLFG